MAYTFGSILFTPAVKALQERYGSRRQYARMETHSDGQMRFGPNELEFIAERDSFYMASIGEGGWPYVQHRGGPAGFLKALDDRTIAFADFRGNKQFITTGNLSVDDRVALILVDYPRQARLKIVGRAEIIEKKEAGEWMSKVQDTGYGGVVERVIIIRVEAFDWNCPQHITPRFTTEQIKEAVAPLELRLRELEKENQQLRSIVDK